VGAGDDHPLVDVERHAVEPRLVEKIGGRNSIPDSSPHEAFNVFFSNILFQIDIERQPQSPDHQEGSLIARIAGAVPVVQAGGLESLFGFFD